MSTVLMEWLLWLFVINVGVAFGAGVYESRVLVPQWLSGSRIEGYRWHRDAAVAADVGMKFWAFVTTMPLSLLTLASLIAAFWTLDPLRAWWLGAVAAALVDRLMTFGYFIPTMIGLMRNADGDDPAAIATARQWVRLGAVRHAATLIAWLAAMRAFALFYQQV